MAAITPIRAVLDTSALYGSHQRRDLQQLAQRRLYIGIWSPWVITELTRVLTWAWAKDRGVTSSEYAACSTACTRMMEYLLPTFELVHPLPPYPPAWPQLADQWDMPIWATAKLANAQCVISENTRDFPPVDNDGYHRWDGIEYITGASFIDRLVGAVSE